MASTAKTTREPQELTEFRSRPTICRSGGFGVCAPRCASGYASAAETNHLVKYSVRLSCVGSGLPIWFVPTVCVQSKELP